MCNEFLKHVAETVARRCFFKKMLLKISQNSQENTCAKSLFLIKLQATTTLLKRRLWRRCFPVNFPEFLRTPFFQHFLRVAAFEVVRTYFISLIYSSYSISSINFDFLLLKI